MHCVISFSPGLPLTHLSSLCLCPSAKRRRWSESGLHAMPPKQTAVQTFPVKAQAGCRQQVLLSHSHPHGCHQFSALLTYHPDYCCLPHECLRHGHLVLIKAAVYPLNPANAPTHERRRRQRLGNRWFGGEVEVATWRT